MFKFIFILSLAFGQTYIKGPALIQGVTSTSTAAGTTTLTKDSQTNQFFTGSTTQTLVLPDATTLPVGRQFYVGNRSSGIVTVNFNGGGLARSIKGNDTAIFVLKSAGTNAGTWDITQPIILTPNLTVITDSVGLLTTSAVTSAELLFMSGASSNIQTQLNGKQPTGSYITALSSDVVATGPGSASATIQSNVVTNAKLAQMPTLTMKGNNTGGTANVLDLTVAQIKTMLGIVTPTRPKITTYIGSNSGTHTITGSPLYVCIQIVAGGSGGASYAGVGLNGGLSSFDTISCTAGTAGGNNLTGGPGGTCTQGAGWSGLIVPGGRGQGGTDGPVSNYGAMGGASMLGPGGAGGTGYSGGLGPGYDGVLGSGGGGAGGQSGVTPSAGGGSGGGYKGCTTGTVAASYSFVVGDGGTGAANAGTGGKGQLVIYEYYQ